jgi:hypothetical protein
VLKTSNLRIKLDRLLNRIEAAIRSGNLSLSHSLTSERLVHKPLSPLSLRFANKQVI